MVSPILADVLCRSSKASTADKGSFCEVPGLAQTPCSSGTPDNAFSPFFPLQSKDARALLKLLNFGINWGFFLAVYLQMKDQAFILWQAAVLLIRRRNQS